MFLTLVTRGSVICISQDGDISIDTSLVNGFSTEFDEECHWSVQVKRAHALEHFNVGGTFITDVAVLAIASHCSRLKVSHPLPTATAFQNCTY